MGNRWRIMHDNCWRQRFDVVAYISYRYSIDGRAVDRIPVSKYYLRHQKFCWALILFAVSVVLPPRLSQTRVSDSLGKIFD